MQCNIDARGKAVRLILGLVMIGAALLLSVLSGLGLIGLWGWALTVGLFVFGVFGVFEGWAGWCMVRAMGFKTRL
ncbi:MAG: hypothetical protein AAGC44_06295 [Planctomycetota bacterium]